MLSSAQIQYALSSKRIQHVALSDCEVKVCHTDDSVFVIFFDGERAIESQSFMVQYDILALINTIEWPCFAAGERKAVVAFGDKKYIVKTESSNILKDPDTGEWKSTSLVEDPPLDFFGFPTVYTVTEYLYKGRRYFISGDRIIDSVTSESIQKPDDFNTATPLRVK